MANFTTYTSASLEVTQEQFKQLANDHPHFQNTLNNKEMVLDLCFLDGYIPSIAKVLDKPIEELTMELLLVFV